MANEQWYKPTNLYFFVCYQLIQDNVSLYRRQCAHLPGCWSIPAQKSYASLSRQGKKKRIEAFCESSSSPGLVAWLTPSHSLKSTCLFVQDRTATRQSLAGREFQLEEREDRDSSYTDLWLNQDGTVTMGVTDGPKPVSYQGDWHVLETATTEADRPFRLRLDRTYENPNPHTGETDTGPFDYHVKREFWGNVGPVRHADSVEVEGVIHRLDELNNLDCEVGYFALVDSTKEEEEEDFGTRKTALSA